MIDAQNDSALPWAEEKIEGCLPLLIVHEAEEMLFLFSYFIATGRTTNPVIQWKRVSKCNGFTTKPASKTAE